MRPIKKEEAHEIEETRTFDVLVVGGGIAGTTAALHAARSGARTALACAGALFSGSSFYPARGVWGLWARNRPTTRTILSARYSMSAAAWPTPASSRRSCGTSPPPSTGLRRSACASCTRTAPTSGEFVPCFDRKHRLWRGIVRESYEEAAGRELARLGVEVLPGRELVDLVEQDDAVAGAVLAARDKGRFELVGSKATVLATGGFGGLFERRLTAIDVAGGAHAVALAHGCALVNLEFMQMMPGLASPVSGHRVQREDVSPRRSAQPGRHGSFRGPTRRPSASRGTLGATAPSPRGSRRARSTSPWTPARPEGLVVRYRTGGGKLPEFVRTYFDWLEEAAGVRPSTSCASRRTPMRPTAASSSTLTDPAACRACSPAARPQAACTEPTA